MKKSIILVLFIICSVHLFAQEMDYEKLHFYLSGVISLENKLVAYGSSGHVLVSMDNGETWNSVKIFDDSVTIEKMVIYNGSIYGICFNGIIFKTDSDLNLTSWSQYNNESKYYDFVVNENAYILSSNNSIKVLNADFKQSDEILIDTLYPVSNIVYLNSYLYLATQKGKIVSVNLSDNNSISLIDISSSGQDVKQIIAKNNSLLLNIDNNAYELNLLSGNMEFLSATVTLLGLYDNNIYDLRKKSNTSKNVAWLELYKLENAHFELVTKDSIDRYVTPDLNILDYKFVDSNNLIAVGANKTIYISNSKGEKFTLKSMFKLYGKKYWLNELSGYSINTQGQIFRTENGGITWLPQKFTDSYIQYSKYEGSLESTFFMNENGVGFYWFVTGGVPIKDTTKIYNTLYTEDFGETFTVIWDWGFGGKFYQRAFASQFEVETININNSLITSIVPQKGDFTKNNLTFVFEIDPEHQKSKSTIIDSISIVAMTKFENKLYALMWERRHPSKDIPFWFDSTKKWIASSIDMGKNWKYEFELSIDSNSIDHCRYKKDNILLIEQANQFVKVNKDSGYSIYSLYYIDIKSKSYTRMYYDTTFYNKATGLSEDSPQILMIYKDYVYIKNKFDEIVKCSVKDIYSPIWEKVNFFRDNSLFSVVVYTNDSIIYCSDKKFYPKSTTSVDDNQIENNKYIFAVPPFPQPAVNNVNLQFYLGEKINPSECHIDIYNIYGIKKNYELYINSYLLSDNLIEYKWNTENTESGIYLVKFSNKYKSIVTKVIVVK